MNNQIVKNSGEKGAKRVHFLNENAVRLNRSLGEIAGLKNLGFHIIEVEPGFESTEYHFHHYEDECCYVLSGTATITIGEEDFRVGAGDFIGYPAGGEAHSMKNTGETTLVCIIAGQRLESDIVDYPRLNKRLYCHSEAGDLVDIADIVDV